MCGGKKETDKKIQGPPLPEVSEEVVEPPAEEETPAPPPVEEPKGSVSATKSEFGTDTQMAANAQSIALMSTRPGHGAGYARKGNVYAYFPNLFYNNNSFRSRCSCWRPKYHNEC